LHGQVDERDNDTDRTNNLGYDAKSSEIHTSTVTYFRCGCQCTPGQPSLPLYRSSGSGATGGGSHSCPGCFPANGQAFHLCSLDCWSRAPAFPVRSHASHPGGRKHGFRPHSASMAGALQGFVQSESWYALHIVADPLSPMLGFATLCVTIAYYISLLGFSFHKAIDTFLCKPSLFIFSRVGCS
jgi:hypothetical protein